MFGLLISLIGFIKSFTLTTTKAIAKKVDFAKVKKGEVGTKKLTNKQKVTLSLEYTKALFLVGIGVVIALFEMFPIFMLVMLLLLVLIIVIIFVVVLMHLQSILDLNVENYQKPATEGIGTNSCSRSISTEGLTLNFTQDELTRSGGLLSDIEKNYYRAGIYVTDALDGYGGTKYFNEMPQSIRFYMNYGILSTEDSMRFYKSLPQTSDISKVVSDKMNDSGFILFGVNKGEKITGDVGSRIKAKYPAPTTVSYEGNYAPWGAYISARHFYGKYAGAFVNRKDIDVVITQVMNDWGVPTEEQKELRMYLQLFTTTSLYHGMEYWKNGRGTMDGELEAYLTFQTAVYMASEDANGKRSYMNYSLDGGYDESALRTGIVGYQEVKQPASSPNSPGGARGTTKTKIYVNGQLINETLWQYVVNKYNTKQEIKDAWRVLAGLSAKGGGYSSRVLNFHYGLNSLLQAKSVVEGLSEKMGAISTTTSNTTTLECDTASTGSEGVKGDFKNKKGTFNATLDGKPLQEYIDTTGKIKYLLHKGWVDRMKSQSGYASSLDKDSKDPAYGKEFKYSLGVPFYNQATKVGWGGMQYQPYSSTFNYVGCAVYSMAYCATLSTGEIVNPPEVAIIAYMTGQQTINGASRDQEMAKMFGRMGIEAGFMGNSISNSANFDKIYKELQKGDRVVLFRSQKRGYTNSNHYMVFNSIVEQNGEKFVTLYSSVPNHKAGLLSLAEARTIAGRSGANGQTNGGNATWVKYK